MARFDDEGFEYREDDPNAPKPTCPKCDGAGEYLNRDNLMVPCYWCHGTGVDDTV